MMQTAPSVFTRPFQGLLARYRASLHKGQTQRALRIYEALRTYVQAHRYWKKQPLGRGGWGYGGIGRSFTITSRCGGFRTGSRLGFGIGVPHGRLLIFENIPRPLVLEWIPSLRTNHKGIASFQTRFPPTKAQWELSIVAHTPQTRTGQRSFLLTSTP